MVEIYSNEYFKHLSKDELISWIEYNKYKLIGSALFTKNNSLTSKVVRWAENWGEKDKNKFTPSHTGSIIEYNNDVYVFDMKPMKATVTPLLDYILNTKDEYRLVLRDFLIDGRMFSLNISYKIGDWYPFMSAIRSVFTKRKSKYKQHCSEAHLAQLQLQGKYLELNPEIAPDELYYAMTQ